MNFIKIKTICSVKGTVKRMKRQVTDWEKYLQKQLSDEGLVTKIYKVNLKFNIKKTNNPT